MGTVGRRFKCSLTGRETLQPESTGVIIKVNLWLKIVNRQKNMSSRVFMEIQKIDTGLKPRFWYSIALESRTAHEARGARKDEEHSGDHDEADDDAHFFAFVVEQRADG